MPKGKTYPRPEAQSSRLDDLRSRLETPLEHPNVKDMLQSGQEAMAWAIEHFSSLNSQPLRKPTSRAEMETLLYEPLPETGIGFAEAFAEFKNKIVPYAWSVNHPRFFSFVPGSPTFVSVLAELLTATSNYFGGVWLEAPGPSQIEILVLDWFKELLSLPAEARGVLTSGGSEANLTALVVARQAVSSGVVSGQSDPPRKPTHHSPLTTHQSRLVLYVSEQRHFSMDRAAMVIGLAPEQIRRVPVDSQYRMQVAALADFCRIDREAGWRPWAVVANAGSTNTGSVDPLPELAALCRREQLWLHVDAAYGWTAVLTPEGRQLLRGIDQADSITLDPHKWFAQPYESGALLIRNGRLLTQTFQERPDYLQDVRPAEEEVNFADCGLALSRRFRALKIWLSIKVLGLDWFRRLVQRCLWLAEYAEELLKRSPCFEILCPRQLSIVTFRVRPVHGTSNGRATEEFLDRFNLQLVERVLGTHRAAISSTRLNGKVALRMCFVNWRTGPADVEEVVRLLEQLA